MREQAAGVRRIEVADGGARKEAELGDGPARAPAAAARRRSSHCTGMISRPGKRRSSRRPGIGQRGLRDVDRARRRADARAPRAPARSCGSSPSRTRPAPRRARRAAPCCARARAGSRSRCGSDSTPRAGDLLEQLAADRVVEVLARQPLARRRTGLSARPRRIRRARSSRALVPDRLCAGRHASSARRMPVNCQR